MRARRTVTGVVVALSLALGGLSLVSGLGDKLGGWMQPLGKSWASVQLIDGKTTPSEGTLGKSWAASVPAPPTTM